MVPTLARCCGKGKTDLAAARRTDSTPSPRATPAEAEDSTRQVVPVAQNLARDALASVPGVARLLNPDCETPRPGLAYVVAQESEQVSGLLITPVRP
jgi:hypothetical protein